MGRRSADAEAARARAFVQAAKTAAGLVSAAVALASWLARNKALVQELWRLVTGQ